MKFNYRYLILLVTFFVASCDYSDVNVNPNNPTSAPAGTILLTAQTYLAYTMYDDIGRVPGIVMQQIAGSANQSAVIGQYNITEGDINTAWSNMYRGSMNACLDVIALTEENSPHMSGVAKVVLALTLGNVTDVWGDVPWTEALQGSDNLTPAYDNQEFIYTEIQRLLDEAIVELSAAESAESPSANNDRFYGGNLDNWIAAAYTAKAKYYNNLSEVNASQSASDALNAIDNGFTSVDQDMAFDFVSTQNGQNPIGAFFTVQRVGDASMGEFYVNELMGDPRLTILVGQDGSGNYTGAPAGSAESASGLGTFYSTLSAPTFVLTYAEAKFIEAEAALRANNLTRAQTAFEEGIQASMDQYGVDPVAAANYITANGTLSGNALEDIITEKYISLFLNPQVWTDWRRTGFPNISPAANNVTNNEIPVKFPYPQQERTYNGANVNAASGGQPQAIDINVWWDQ